MTASRFRTLHDTRGTPIGSGFSVVRSGESVAVVSADDQRLLRGCTGFASLDDHAARIAAGTPISHGDVRERLVVLAAAGLLASEDEILARLRADADQEAERAIETIGIATRNRPHCLDRLLASLAGAASERDVEVVVADDGRTAEERAATQAVVTRHTKHLRLRIAYAEHRARYAEDLARAAALDPSDVAFALGCGADFDAGAAIGTGACRNALLLDAAGTLLLFADDDTRLPLVASPERGERLALVTRGDTSQLFFPAPGEDAAGLGVELQEDLLALHERLLGRSLRACARAAETIDLEDASGALLDVADEAQVMCTMAGLCGDSATGSLGFYLLLAGSARERLQATEAGYRHAMRSRQLLRVPPSWLISNTSHLMAYSLGLDARQPLAPFPPLFRNQDGVAGAALRATDPRALSGYLPAAVRHEPPGARSHSVDQLVAKAQRVLVNDLLGVLLTRLALRVRLPAADALRLLGESLQACSGDPVELGLLTRDEILRVRALEMSALNDALVRHGCEPDWWAQDVRRLLMGLEDAIDDPALAHPVELADVDELAAYFSRYGRLLAVWSKIHAAAVKLRGRAERLGERV